MDPNAHGVPMDRDPQDKEETDGADSQSDGKTINDPLTRGDVEAPRAEFEGRAAE